MGRSSAKPSLREPRILSATSEPAFCCLPYLLARFCSLQTLRSADFSAILMSPGKTYASASTNGVTNAVLSVRLRSTLQKCVPTNAVKNARSPNRYRQRSRLVILRRWRRQPRSDAVNRCLTTSRRSRRSTAAAKTILMRPSRSMTR